MINTSMNWKNNAFLLKPCGKDYLWGGTRLNDDFSKDMETGSLAESWECSAHPEGPSVVASGKHQGMTLAEVLQEHPEYLGTHPGARGEFPVLVKLIDARNNLSVQVHPDDEYARVNENGSMGKTEMWYVLDAKKDAKLIYGFYHDIDKNTLRKSIQKGTVEKYLQKVPIQKDDVFYIEAGTVHAIGAGALIAEVQESSNLTYRLFDYNRVDKNGKQRELHVEKALDVANLKSSAEPRQPMRVLKYTEGCATELLCRCRHFQTERMLINTERCRKMVDFHTQSNSFQVLLCVDGCGVIFQGMDEELLFFKGDCVFVPADSVPIKIHGRAKFLKISC